MQIVALIAQGLKNKAIAEQLGTKEQVVKNYLRTIYDKTGVSDRLELAILHPASPCSGRGRRKGRYPCSKPGPPERSNPFSDTLRLRKQQQIVGPPCLRVRSAHVEAPKRVCSHHRARATSG